MKMLESKVGLRADRILGLTAAAAAAATGAGLVGDASMASADIVYSGPVNINVTNDTDGIYFNVVTGDVSGWPPAAGWDLNPYSAGTNTFNLWGPTVNTWFNSAGVVSDLPGYVLAAGTQISGDAATNFFRPGGANNVGTAVTLNAPNLFGFRFVNESMGNQEQFGWVEITFGDNSGSRAITAYAYENSGAGIAAGAVPEPTSLSVLALGALGLVARRRRRAM